MPQGIIKSPQGGNVNLRQKENGKFEIDRRIYSVESGTKVEIIEPVNGPYTDLAGNYYPSAEFYEVQGYSFLNGDFRGYILADLIEIDHSQPAQNQPINNNPVPAGLAILGLVGLALIFSRNK
jgi:hypothetical protein